MKGRRSLTGTARRRRRSALPAALLPVALLLAGAPARAQSTTFYLDRLQIAGAPDDGLGVWRPRIGPSRAFGQLALGYSLNPLRVANVVDDVNKAGALSGPPVAGQLTTHVTAGAELLERFSVQVTLPVVVFQSGSKVDNAGAGLPQAVTLAPSAPEDLRLDSRVLLVRSEDGMFQLAGRAAVFFPLGNERSFAGDSGAWGQVGLATELDLERLSIVLNTGASIRPKAALHQLTVGSELTYGLAAYMPFLGGRLRLGAELFGSLGLLPETIGETSASPLEWSLNGRLFVNEKRTVWVGLGAGTRLTDGYAPDFRLVALAGGALALPIGRDEDAPVHRPAPARLDSDSDRDGIPDLLDACPTEPEDQHAPAPDDGCPDHDEDGIPDAEDRCPDAAEDMDGIDDDDGCAEVDADKDGVPDAEDRCPKEPGVSGGAGHQDGCPQLVRRVQEENAIELMKQIDFARDQATIDPSSFPVLDQVVRLLETNTDIESVRISGHTDNIGNHEYNQNLSEARAAAVRDYLVKHGIAAGRVTSHGFGSAKPLTSNDTPEGRAKNRRVEIHFEVLSTAPEP